MKIVIIFSLKKNKIRRSELILHLNKIDEHFVKKGIKCIIFFK